MALLAACLRITPPDEDDGAETTDFVTTTAFVTAVAHQAARADAFVHSVGVNTHLNYSNVYANYPRVKASLQYPGVKHIRDGGGVFNDRNYMTRVYGRMRDLNATLGIRVGWLVN